MLVEQGHDGLVAESLQGVLHAGSRYAPGVTQVCARDAPTLRHR